MQDMSEFREVFFEEMDEQIQIMEEELLALEHSGGQERGIPRLFRAAHTLKGSAAAMGFERTKGLTHEMEHVLDQLRQGRFVCSPSLLTLFFEGLDMLKKLRQELVHTQEERTDTTPMIKRLRAFDNGAVSAGKGQPEHSEPDAFAAGGPKREEPALSEEELLTLSRCGDPLLSIRVTLAPDCRLKQARLFIVEDRLKQNGTIVRSPAETTDETDDEQIGEVAWLLATGCEPERLRELLGGLLDVRDVRCEPYPREGTNAPEQAGGMTAADREEGRAARDGVFAPGSDEAAPALAGGFADPAADPATARRSAGDDAGALLRSSSQTIRVNIKRLDHLMNLVGELVIDQTRLTRLGRKLREGRDTQESLNDWSELSDHFSRLIGELQESVMKVRMLPIQQLFSRFPRMIRDLALELNKEIELVLEGSETELDRTLIDEIGDPMIHLLRNAVDHGIEPAALRLASGKPEKGNIRISASHEDSQVLITVQDDGAGIDPERIRASAVSKGFITATEAAQLSDQEAIHLIFHPGFSTAAQISEISGRGVGMDIVRSDIERLNGSIEIGTAKGKGTAFFIRLPLTLAITTGLLVRVGAQTFIFPLNNVDEIVRIKPSAIRYIKGEPVITIRSEIVPMIWLHDHFGYSRQTEARGRIPTVVIGRGGRKLAIAVDDLLGSQEVVMKSLGSYVGAVEGVSGATILGNGKVALILEAGGIMSAVHRLA